MELVASSILLAVLVIISLLVLPRVLGNRYGGRRLPPGPIGLPLLGRLPFLSPDLHRCFADLARSYGPVLSFRLGTKLCAVVSSPSAAAEVLRTHDAIFANRPPSAVVTISTGDADLAWAPNGPHWRMLRKVAVRELLSSSVIDSFASLRRKELRRIVGELQSRAGDAVNVRNMIYATSLNVITSMMWGGELGGVLEEEAREVIDAMIDLAGAPNISDFLPVVAPLDLQGLQRRMRGLSNRYNVIFGHIIRTSKEINRRDTDEGPRDFLRLLLDLVSKRDPEVPLQHDHVKNLLFVSIMLCILQVLSS